MNELWFTIKHTKNTIEINSNWFDVFAQPERRYLLIRGVNDKYCHRERKKCLKNWTLKRYCGRL